MNIQLLKLFCDVAKYGSINRAARVNFLSPSSVSRALQTLERETNTVFFSRSHEGMALTRQGHEFLGMVEPIVHDFNQLEQVYCAPDEKPELLRLTLCVHQNSIAVQCLVDFYNQYADKANYVDIVMATCASLDEVVRNMNNKYYMLGIIQYSSNRETEVAERLKANNLQILHVNYRKSFVAVRNGHPLSGRDGVTLEDLAAYTRVAYINETVPDINYCADIDNFDYTGTRKRILIRERGQIHDIVGQTDAYFVGTSDKGIQMMEGRFDCIPLKGTDIKIVTALISREGYTLTQNAQRYAEHLAELFQETE